MIHNKGKLSVEYTVIKKEGGNNVKSKPIKNPTKKA